MPVQQPFVTAVGADWQPVVTNEIGRFRVNGRGRLFAYSTGAGGQGYALCLDCGRAASDHEEDEIPATLKDHFPLSQTAVTIGSRRNSARKMCRGNESPWRIRRNVWLGVAKETDVFELQLRLQAPDSKEQRARAASSIAVALRRALAERIGVEDREIGWRAVAARDEDGTSQVYSILLYDMATGGAGFSTQAPAHLPSLMRRAREILLCSSGGCDGACQHCLLAHDTSYLASSLNRVDALEYLTPEFVARLDLPEALRFLGATSRFEAESLSMALARELRGCHRVRLYLSGDTSDWDLEDWPLRRQVGVWSVRDVRTELLMPLGTVKALDTGLRNRLASLAEAGQISVIEIPRDAYKAGKGVLMAECGGAHHHVRFAGELAAATSLSGAWGAPGQTYVCGVADGELPEIPGSVPIGAELLRVRPFGTVAMLSLTNELQCPIEQFGRNLLVTITSRSTAEIVARLNGKVPIARVTYRDRYLKSPLTLRLIIELLRSLKGIVGADMTSAQVLLQSREPSSKELQKAGYSKPNITGDWPANAKIPDIALQAMVQSGIAGEMQLLPYGKIEHARELRIDWKDGAYWWVRFDEGVSFLEPDRFVTFDHFADIGKQVQQLLTAKYGVRHRNKTEIYLSDLLR